MSLRKRFSFKKKPQSEYSERSLLESTLFSEACKVADTNGRVLLSSPCESAATVSENGEISASTQSTPATGLVAQQYAENNEPDLENSSIVTTATADSMLIHSNTDPAVGIQSNTKPRDSQSVNTTTPELTNGTIDKSITAYFHPVDVVITDCEPDLSKETQDFPRNTDLSKTNKTQSLAIPDGIAMDPMSPSLALSSEFMERLGSGLTLLRGHGKKIQKYVRKSGRFDSFRRSWKTVVNVVLVEAKDLPDVPPNGSNCVYCKFKLGAETHKSKQVPKSKPSWCERFNLHLNEENHFEITVWHKGKQKNFMGRCKIDLSQLEKEKTHDLWQELECGYGSLHLLVTLSGIVRSMPVDNVPTTNGVRHIAPPEDDFSWYRFDNNWNDVGRLSVTVYGAKGLGAVCLGGRADAYCVLELDNSRVQTHTVHGSSDPNWNKSYNFGVSDITSTLEITIYDESIINLKEDVLGKVSIPLLRINNDEKRWYALKDRSGKSSAKGNCPRILLQMSIVWNPIKASLRVLSPKENKYVQKQPKFDIPLIYSNVQFIKNVFDAIYLANVYYKNLFEWDNREKSAVALIAWLAFCYFIKLWMTPLLILAPFFYNWSNYWSCNNSNIAQILPSDDEQSEDDEETIKDDKTIKMRLYNLQELTFTIKDSIDYIVSLLERLRNLSNFTVPYLSYLAMIVLVVSAAALYLIPINYLCMALGIYKFTRKVLNPKRVPNNDLLDFLSRVPDSKTLKLWRELKVPEPNQSRSGSMRRR